MNQVETNKFKWIPFALVLMVLFSFYPYEFYSVYFRFIPTSVEFTAILSVICGAIYFFRSNRVKLPNSILWVFIVQYLGLMIHNEHCGMNFNAQIFSLLTLLLPVFLLLYADSTLGLLEFYRRYNKWILIMATLGTIAWILYITIGFSPFYVVPCRADDRLIYNFFLTFCKMEIGDSSMRYCGFFDEPGAMGYWGLYALIINRLFIKDSKLELILAILLLFTFSFGYYMQLLAYLLFFHIDFKNKKKSLLYIFLFGLLIIGAKSTEGTNFGFVYESTVGRVEQAFDQSKESENALAVDTRAGLVEDTLEEFNRNPLLGTTKTGERIGNCVYEPLALYGILGTPLVLFPFIFWLITAIKNRDAEYFKALLVILLGFTHRPFKLALLYIFILYSIIYMYQKYGTNRETIATI